MNDGPDYRQQEELEHQQFIEQQEKTMPDTAKANGLALMRTPFPANQISYLPKGGVKLAYVGHAALTDRLLDADPAWSWEPLAMGAHGLPVMDEMGGMWIKLTVCGVTRLGYGHAGSKTGGDAIKEVIGDALRNAAMRFGAALDLWHRGELHAHDQDAPAPRSKTDKPPVGDTSPKARALRITAGVAGGDAAGVAESMASWPQDEFDAIWTLLDEKTADKINAVWSAAKK